MFASKGEPFAAVAALCLLLLRPASAVLLDGRAWGLDDAKRVATRGSQAATGDVVDVKVNGTNAPSDVLSELPPGPSGWGCMRCVRALTCPSDTIHFAPQPHRFQDRRSVYVGVSRAKQFCGRFIANPDSDISNYICCPPKALLISPSHSGSTSLSLWLEAHHRMFVGLAKEHDFFASLNQTTFTSEEVQEMRTLYASRFPAESLDGEAMKMGIDASPNYQIEKKEVAELAKQVIGPDGRLLFVLRNPVDVLYSLLGNENPQTFHEAVLNVVNNALKGTKGRSGVHELPHEYRKMCYIDSLDTWMTVFDPQELLVIDTRCMSGGIADRRKVVTTVASFVGASASSIDDSVLGVAAHVVNIGKSNPILPETRRFLAEAFLTDCNRGLADFFGINIDFLGWDKPERVPEGATEGMVASLAQMRVRTDRKQTTPKLMVCPLARSSELAL